MAAIDPDLVERNQITGLSTDPDGSLGDQTAGATDDVTAGQTIGEIKNEKGNKHRGVKVTWNLGHADLADGDTISVFLHNLRDFPPLDGYTFSCMPYITANTVNTTPSNWIEVVSPVENAFNVFTLNAAFRAALVDLDGNGKFSVRLMIDGPPSTKRRSCRWSEVDSNLTPPGGGVVVNGTSSLAGVGLVDAFGRFVRGGSSSVVGAGVVTATGNLKKGGVSSVLGQALVTAFGFVGGGVQGASALIGECVASAIGTVKRDSGPVSVVGAGVVTAVGSIGDDPEIDGAATYQLDLPRESVTLISDGANWWVV